MPSLPVLCAAVPALLALLGAAHADAAVTPVAEGLHSPVRVTRLDRDAVLIAEGGLAANAGRVSVLRRGAPGWDARPLLTGLPTGFDPNAQAFLGPADAEPLGHVLHVLIGIGDARYGAPGSASSPILSSVLQVVFSRPVAALAGTFALDRADHDRLAAGRILLKRSGGELALVRLLADIPDVVLRDGVESRSNPFDMELVGRELLVSDSARNDLIAIDVLSGAQREVIAFGELASGGEAVPTGLARAGDGVLVALEGGGDTPAGGSEVRRVDRRGGERVVARGLSDAIDVELHAGRLHVLELSADIASFAPGRLLRATRSGFAVIDDSLFFPSSFTRDARSDGWLVTQPFLGNVVLVEEEPAAPVAAN